MSNEQRVVFSNTAVVANMTELVSAIVNEAAGGEVARTLDGTPIRAGILAETITSQIQARLARYREKH